MLAAASEADACGCTDDSGTCSAYRSFDTIFIGRVVSVPSSARIRRDGTVEATDGIGLAHVAVIRTFKGVREKSVTIPVGNTTCDVLLRVGRQYLIYGTRSERAVRTSTCTPTRPLAEAVEDVKYLESAGRNGLAASVYGALLHRGEDSLAPDPLPGPIRIVLEGVNGTFETVTTHSRYEVDGIAPGPYTLRAWRDSTPVSAPISLNVSAGECSRNY